MRLQRTSTCAGLLAGSLLALANMPAQAFTFTTNFTGSAPKGDLTLDSVELADGTIFSNFSLVTGANIVTNDQWTHGNTGAASADMGDEATVGLSEEAATNSGIVAALGNLNLNSIIDTEEKGAFAIDLSFASAVDNLFFWERGMNSTIGIQALDAGGNLIGNVLTPFSGAWQSAGYSIDTVEIRGAQKVGSLGITLADLGVASPISAIRVFSQGPSFNGPDFKVVGSAASVPEPATVMGLGLLAGALVASRRKTEKQA